MRPHAGSRFLSLALLFNAFLPGGADASEAPAQPGETPAAVRGLRQADVFVSGRDGYHTFRIPSLLATPRGTLLAFCEGRKDGRGDSGDIDLVMRRSPDGGASWGDLQVIADGGSDTLGNPCPVVERETGTIWMPLTRNLGPDTQRQILDGTARGTRTVWLMKSTDDGRTWSAPAEITADVKAPDWTWVATGPGVAIQLRSGRLVVPCDHYAAGSRAAGAHVIYSDDRGATWRRGGVIGGGVNECQVVELGDGTLLLNLRNAPPRRGEGRAIGTSQDGGLTWSAPACDPALPEPGCQASLIRVDDGEGRAPARLLFSNPAGDRREGMTVKLSEDAGRTWPVARVLHAGPSAYSCLAVLPGRGFGCLYERGERQPYERITFAAFDRGWLGGGPDAPTGRAPR
jgi:sialidase-1